jgi:hypothetical protein
MEAVNVNQVKELPRRDTAWKREIYLNRCGATQRAFDEVCHQLPAIRIAVFDLLVRIVGFTVLWTDAAVIDITTMAIWAAILAIRAKSPMHS